MHIRNAINILVALILSPYARRIVWISIKRHLGTWPLWFCLMLGGLFALPIIVIDYAAHHTRTQVPPNQVIPGPRIHQDLNDQASAGGAIVSNMRGKTVILGPHTYTLADAGTTKFADHWSACFTNVATSSNATLKTPTSIFTGETRNTGSLVIAPGDSVCLTSDRGNWITATFNYGAPGGASGSIQYNNTDDERERSSWRPPARFQHNNAVPFMGHPAIR